MRAFWLTYKPLSSTSPRGWPASELSALVESFAVSPASATPLWRIASHRVAKRGDRFYLFKQGSGARGIFGSGQLIEDPRLQEDFNDIEGGETYRARIQFDDLVDPAHRFLIDLEEMRDIISDELLNAQSSGVGVPEAIASDIERHLARNAYMSFLDNSDADDHTFDPSSAEDQRERSLRAICIRRGQPEFRADLLKAYGRRCVISNCSVEAVLEAAHITPYRGEYTNDTSNGLLLRADLHTLFDCWLMAIDPATRRVIIAQELEASSYRKLAGRTLRLPTDPRLGPSKSNLEKRFAKFQARHKVVLLDDR